MVRTATPFPMVSLLFVFTAFVISNIGHIRPQRTILAFVSGIFFILSGTVEGARNLQACILCAQFKVHKRKILSHCTVSLVHKVELCSVHADFVFVHRNKVCKQSKTHWTQILSPCVTTTDSRLFLSRFVSIFSNYSAVCCSHCKAAWETNLSTQLSENLWMEGLWRTNPFSRNTKCVLLSIFMPKVKSSELHPTNRTDAPPVRSIFLSFGRTSPCRSQRFMIKWLNPTVNYPQLLSGHSSLALL